jgi:MYXO-CTERM domain-containing protein
VIVDADGDGANDGPDCDDTDPKVNPGAEELCNGVDDDCDGDTDEGCETDTSAGGGDSSDGATSETSDDSNGDGATSGGASEGTGLPGPGGGLPQGGSRGDAGCGCDTSGGASPALFTLAAFALLRRRRRVVA